METSKVLITGVSSGIGRVLTKRLITDGHIVWGIARRLSLLETLEKELGKSNRLTTCNVDISRPDSWSKLCQQMKRKKFIPEIIIFNAATNRNDFSPSLDSMTTREIFNVNFFSIIAGVENLLKFVKIGTQFIAISSLSALKGSGVEGIGYPASKAALSIAFESLYRKFGDKYSFKTIYFGPIAGGMGPFKKILPIILSESQAVDKIVNVIKSRKLIHYAPQSIFFALRVMKFLPSGVYFALLARIESFHLKLAKRVKA